MTAYEQTLGDSEKKNFLLTGRDVRQNQAPGSNHIGVEGRKTGQRYTVVESQRLITTNYYMQSGA